MALLLFLTICAALAGGVYFLREAKKAGRDEAMVEEAHKDLDAWEKINETVAEMEREGDRAVRDAVRDRTTDSSGRISMPDDGYKRPDPE